MECVSVCGADYLGGYSILLRFNTGETGVVDLKDVIFSNPIAAPLRDPAKFACFHLDSWPTLAWDCGFDIAPESLLLRAVQIHKEHDTPLNMPHLVLI